MLWSIITTGARSGIVNASTAILLPQSSTIIITTAIIRCLINFLYFQLFGSRLFWSVGKFWSDNLRRGVPGEKQYSIGIHPPPQCQQTRPRTWRRLPSAGWTRAPPSRAESNLGLVTAEMCLLLFRSKGCIHPWKRFQHCIATNSATYLGLLQ